MYLRSAGSSKEVKLTVKVKSSRGYKGVSIKYSRHRKGCFLLVRVYRKSGDGAALCPVAPHHKSNFHFFKLWKFTLVNLPRCAIGNVKLDSFVSQHYLVKHCFFSVSEQTCKNCVLINVAICCIFLCIFNWLVNEFNKCRKNFSRMQTLFVCFFLSLKPSDKAHCVFIKTFFNNTILWPI